MPNMKVVQSGLQSMVSFYRENGWWLVKVEQEFFRFTSEGEFYFLTRCCLTPYANGVCPECGLESIRGVSPKNAMFQVSLTTRRFTYPSALTEAFRPLINLVSEPNAINEIAYFLSNLNEESHVVHYSA